MTSILVIDDEVDLLGVFARVLKRIGHTVSLADNGLDGIRMFENNPPDLVLTDLVMPGIDGHEVARYIRSSEHKRVPVVGMSGTPWRAKHDHFDDVLVKPFMLEELVDAIERLALGNTQSPVYA